jgi:ferritin
MLDKKMEEALNAQINREFHSAYLYLSMAAYFDAINLPGFAHWMRAQSGEEMGHMRKFYDHINARQGRVQFAPIAKLDTEWASPAAAFQAALKHEEFITRSIHDLVDTARAAKDKAAENFLAWFVGEQVEEEASAQYVIDILARIGDKGHALIMLDRELAKRGA